MRVEAQLKATDQWQTVMEIEVHTGLCRCRVIQQLQRLERAGKVELQISDKGFEYRWLPGEES